MARSNSPDRGDRLFRWACLGFSLLILGLVAGLAGELAWNSRLAFRAFGLRFLGTQVWDPVAEQFGALPFIYGTLATSAIALVLAVPLGLGTAIFLAELAPPKLSETIGFLVELLAAIPSVIYGLIGVFVLVPLMRNLHLVPYGVGILTAGVVLAVMIVPFITTVSREVLLTVPRSQREAALALGATHWETVWRAILPYARSGLAGSVFLALARALGETMAVTMVIGNRPEVASIFQPGYTMAAVLANEFAEATSDLYLHSLVGIGLVLLGLTVLVNGAARIMLYKLARPVEIRG